jgi:hypothetical protein
VLLSGDNFLPPNVEVATPTETKIPIHCFTSDYFGIRISATIRTICYMRAKRTTELQLSCRRCTDDWMDERVDGSMDGLIAVWVSGRTDGQTDRQINR